MSPENTPPGGEFILYQTEDGRTRVECRFEAEMLWLSQALMADLFQTTPQNTPCTSRHSLMSRSWTRGQLVRISYKFNRRAAVRSGLRQ